MSARAVDHLIRGANRSRGPERLRGVYMPAANWSVRAPFNAYREHDHMQYAGRVQHLIQRAESLGWELR